MTNPQLTYIQAIIDRSGSMQTIRTDAEGGFDAFIAEQRAQGGECRVSLAQFDHEYQVVYQDLPIGQVPPMSIVPRGQTAMLDAIGRTINDLGARLAALPEAERPGTVIVGIVTDGFENASHEFDYQTIHQMIRDQEQIYNWTFLYMGADQDAIEQGAKMGIRAEQALSYTMGSSSQAYSAMSGSISRLRAARARGDSIDEARQAAAYTQTERDATS